MSVPYIRGVAKHAQDDPTMSESVEGRVFRPTSEGELAEAVDKAFDYRGDVTLELASGESIQGYLFNRNARPPRPHVQILLKDQTGSRAVPYEEIVTIAFSGEDTASGKSWEGWVAKKESQRRADAEQVEAAARARGHL